ncbi:MAG: hypothetical protein ACXWL2_03465 [Candidatus Chromulinivorax sp.]
MKKYLFWVCSISLLILAMFWHLGIGRDHEQEIINKENQLEVYPDEQSENVQICAQADTTGCSENSDCNSGNCYAGICEPCEPTGMACNNDGNCCKANCSEGFCGGEDEWVPVYAGVASLGTAIGVGTAGLAGRIGFNYSAYATQEGDLDTAELEDDMDEIINSERTEGLEADMEYAEENPEVVQVTAEDDEDYLEENSSEVYTKWTGYRQEGEDDINEWKTYDEEYNPIAQESEDLQESGEDSNSTTEEIADSPEFEEWEEIPLDE